MTLLRASYRETFVVSTGPVDGLISSLKFTRRSNDD